MVLLGNCLDRLKELPDNSVDSCVTDPPYHLVSIVKRFGKEGAAPAKFGTDGAFSRASAGFMGKEWDGLGEDGIGIANNPDMWREVLRVLKPGGHLLSFSGTRTYHRQAVAIEDAGFEIRDMVEWVYASGFPKSTNVQKQLIKQCKCGNMVEYDRAKQKTKHDLRPMSETDISQTLNPQGERGQVLQSELSEQDTQIQQPEPTENVRVGQPSVEGWSNAQENPRELSRDNLSEMSEGISSDGEERRIHNATSSSNGTTLEQTTNENGSGTSHRPQPEEQQDRKPCAFCEQYGTQEVRRFYDELEGLGSSLKPAHEPICLARKPLEKGRTILSNVLKYGTGGLNIDKSRVGTEEDLSSLKAFGSMPENKSDNKGFSRPWMNDKQNILNKQNQAIENMKTMGRFPANLLHDGSDEVVREFPNTKGKVGMSQQASTRGLYEGGKSFGDTKVNDGVSDSGSAARFFKECPITEDEMTDMFGSGYEDYIEERQDMTSIVSDWNDRHQDELDEAWQRIDMRPFSSIKYCPKASKSERDRGCEGMEETTGTFDKNTSKIIQRRDPDTGNITTSEYKPSVRSNNHPTVKPLALMKYLIQMITPEGGVVLDPFAGSGSTLVAAKELGYDFIGIEMTEEYIPIIEARLAGVKNIQKELL